MIFKYDYFLSVLQFMYNSVRLFVFFRTTVVLHDSKRAIGKIKQGETIFWVITSQRNASDLGIHLRCDLDLIMMHVIKFDNPIFTNACHDFVSIVDSTHVANFYSSLIALCWFPAFFAHRFAVIKMQSTVSKGNIGV